MKLVTVPEMKAVETEADAGGLSYSEMMENAGRGLAEVVLEEFEPLMDEGALGLVGSGNNGGDTLVALTYLAEWGWMLSAYLIRPRPDSDPLLRRFTEAGGRVYRSEEDQNHDALSALLQNHAVVLDGILGTGFQLPLKPEVAEALVVVHNTLEGIEDPPEIVAVDCPSGVDCDSGEAPPETLPADLTVTMAAVKVGILKFPAFSLIGELRMVGIGLPEGDRELESWKAVQRSVVDEGLVRSLLPDRPANAHKGTFGTAVIVAGSVNYTGAAYLAGEAAYRIGTGLVTLAVPAPLHAVLAGQIPEATWLLLPHELGVIAAPAADLLRENLERATAMLIGCGFGLEDTTRDFMARLFAPGTKSNRSAIGFVRPSAGPTEPARAKLPPLVIDADGLKLLARLPDWSLSLPVSTVLTPHPGEMAVLTGLSIEEIQADRIGIALRYSKEWGHVVVLKGAFTVIAGPDGLAAVIPVATAALARAGTGDVLAGLITGLLAQGLDPYSAAIAGAWIHAQAGLRAAEILGNTASVLAGDVLQSVVEVMTELS